ncbi:uncharacterized protein LY89DRAFT_140531 [Mollisia scopiformis]|uniref:Uncharacterized protein n=1 Tax=Mollisia scopiformis TaxID=149040 RepID=A0A194X2R6_MOLSC|nr:uncharacterized protein LY89DRAFT_140531 [Mollisia scopiformis]KUJ14476.1 hypothetical protein LY89DRAFT_140531 [Mollisia scopiformis]
MSGSVLLLERTSKTSKSHRQSPKTYLTLLQGWPKHKSLCKIYQSSNPPPSNTYCGLCGNTDKLTTTKCCGRTICDDQDNYQMFTYSNASCDRNHSRYTLCSSHHKERHGNGKWQDCEHCRKNFTEDESYVGQGTSSFNFKDDVWENAPSFEPASCKTCNKRIKMGSEAHSYGPNGLTCVSCIGGWDVINKGTRGED